MNDVVGTPPFIGAKFYLPVNLHITVNQDGTYTVEISSFDYVDVEPFDDSQEAHDWINQIEATGGQWWDWIQLAVGNLDLPTVIVNGKKPNSDHFKTAEDYRQEFLALLQQGNQ